MNMHYIMYMTKISSPEASIIAQYLPNPNIIFVFPTSVSASTWAEAALFIPCPDKPLSAIALNRFLAWDDFKSQSIKSTQKGKNSIPSVLRELFIQNFLYNNEKETENGSPLLLHLIPPNYAAEAQSFRSWLSSILPSLGHWHKKITVLQDQNDKDLDTLYRHYAAFLDAHNLFDPAWEEPPFISDGKTYVIFYPEVLSDFMEYQHLLKDSPHIKLITLSNSKDDKAPLVLQYENSRQEIRETALYIRSLIKEKKTTYDKIAISLPDSDSYGAYLQRELELYNIPFQYRLGKKLHIYGAAQVFKQIQSCITDQFSFSSLKELLLNTHLPWKEETVQNNLIRFGIQNTCICGYKENGVYKDTWKEALGKDTTAELESRFYNRLTGVLKEFTNTTSFSDIKTTWISFRDLFLDKEKFSDEDNLVLGRCITELSKLIDIENDYLQLQIEKPFDFFVTYLGTKDYLPQNTVRGVSVFPYKVVATAPFDIHIVLNASQESLTILIKQLSFLREDKRRTLELEDDNSSLAFIRLYGNQSNIETRFSCASKTFTGYTIPHNFFTVKQIPADNSQNIEDVLRYEKQWLESQQNITGPKTITSMQKKGFDTWVTRNRNKEKNSMNTILSSEISTIIDEKFRTKENKLNISQSTLKKYFTCPYMWLYERILKMEEITLDASLMEDRWLGTIYHQILSLFFQPLYNKKEKLLEVTSNKRLPEEYEKALQAATGKVIKQYQASLITKQLLETQEKAIYLTLESCLCHFLEFFHGHIILGTEKELSVEKTNYVLKGTIDLILGTGDEETDIILVDFKTGSCPSIKECIASPDDEQNLADFQFASYVTLFENNNENFCPNMEVSKAAFFSIQKREIKPIIGKIKEKQKRIIYRHGDDLVNSFDPTIQQLEKYIQQFVKDINTQQLTSLEQINYSTCRGCNYSTICRTTYKVSGESL